MTCIEELRIQAYLDGELDGAAAQDAERHIAGCAACQAASENAAGLSDAIRRTATRHRAPAELASRIGIALAGERRKRLSRPFYFGAASGVGLSALAACLALLILLPPSAATLAEAVADAHTDALMRGQTMAVLSSSHHTVKPWFAGKVALSPPVADFAGQGFALAGGRLDRIAGAQAAVVVYRHDKHEIDLFVWPDRGAQLPDAVTIRGYHALFWRSGDLNLAAISDMDSGELKKFVALVRRQRE